MILFSHKQLIYFYEAAIYHVIRYQVSLLFTLILCIHLLVFLSMRAFTYADRQVGIDPNRGAGRRVGNVASVGVDEGCSAELQRRIIVGSRRVSCDSGEAKTAAVCPPSPLSPSSSPPPRSAPFLCPPLLPPPEHQRVSVAQARLS